MSLGQRLARLEGPLPGGHLSPHVRAIAQEVAIAWGLHPKAVELETERILAEAASAQALGSTQDLVEFVADLTGQTPAALLADAQYLGA